MIIIIIIIVITIIIMILIMIITKIIIIIIIIILIIRKQQISPTPGCHQFSGIMIGFNNLLDLDHFLLYFLYELKDLSIKQCDINQDTYAIF